MSAAATSYDTPATRAAAAAALRSFWCDPDTALGRWQNAWAWTPFNDASDSCARLAARLLLRGDPDGAPVWAGAHRLLTDRVSRGHREAALRRERAEAVVA